MRSGIKEDAIFVEVPIAAPACESLLFLGLV
jgi:hypothetical protein